LSKTCRGFTVGRTIFHEPSQAWLAGSIDDAELIARVRRTFETLIDAWRDAWQHRARTFKNMNHAMHHDTQEQAA
jgi:myo-inositol catabolism protein IolC